MVGRYSFALSATGCLSQNGSLAVTSSGCRLGEALPAHPVCGDRNVRRLSNPSNATLTDYGEVTGGAARPDSGSAKERAFRRGRQ